MKNPTTKILQKIMPFALFASFALSAFAQVDQSKLMYPVQDEISAYTKDILISQIQEATAPVVKDGFIVFTADEKARHVGIVFDYENYRVIHSFERRSHYAEDDKPVSSVLFYVTDYPKNVETIKYRLVIDGLWTADPLNPLKEFDNATNTMLSKIEIEKMAEPITEKMPSGLVRFVYYGKTGQNIRLAGSFNNWDSYMYTLRETSSGVYQIDLPLPKGTYYYNFYHGTTALVDEKNPKRAYTKDGRKASVLNVE